MSARLIAIAAGTIIVVGIGTGIFMVLGAKADDRFAECRASAIAGGAASIGGPFSLTDHTGARVTDTEIIKGATLIYFGYTTCPDVCPLDNTRNAEAVDMLKERGMNVTPVFITVDPERDTPDVLAEYVGYMHPDMIGLTGSDDEISAVAKAYKAYYARNGSGDDYLMDHSTFTYLMAPGDGFLDFFRRDLSPEDMADQISCFVEHL